MDNFIKEEFPRSWYEATAHQRIEHPQLTEEVQADICVIGAGATGCTAALQLAKKGYKVIVLEAHQAVWGASGRNGGQFISGYSCSMDTIEKLAGPKNGQFFMDASLESLELLKSTVKDYNIDCDLKLGQLAAAIKPAHDKDIQETLEVYEKYGYKDCQYIPKDKVREYLATDRYMSMMMDPLSGHLHPLNLNLGLARAAVQEGAEIYENSPALSYKNENGTVEITTPSGKVKAKYLILAGNAYLKGLNSSIENKVMPVGTYIAATEPMSAEEAKSIIQQDTAVCDLNFVLDYYRLSSDNRMLYGGRVSYSTIDPPSIANSIRKRMVWTFPQLESKKIEYDWGGYVAITMNRAPHFGRVGNNVLFAQGFSGHGVALTLYAGKLMAETISGQEEKFAMFEKIPHVSFPGGRLFRTPMLVLAMSYYKLRDYF